MNTFY